jgi:hypothetical protein
MVLVDMSVRVAVILIAGAVSFFEILKFSTAISYAFFLGAAEIELLCDSTARWQSVF